MSGYKNNKKYSPSIVFFIIRIAMDIEISVVVLRPVGNFINRNDYHYQTLKDNFDVLKFTDVWN
ncbi:putative poly(A)-specific ribonuclease [Helianthus anomalus]